ncbi:MAG: GTPase [Nanoarchaeota archaeon]
MNFEKLFPVESSKVLLDAAFRRAREKSGQKKLTGGWLEIIKKKESIKLDVIQETIVSKFDNILTQFPQTEALPEFYIKLMKLTLDFGSMKKSLGAVNWAAQRLRMLHREYVRKINKAADPVQMRNISKEFYGRAASTLKQIDENLKYLEECRRTMKKYPDVREMFTICIYGFPNVGKTTLLNKLASTKAKTAAYAFTTISINAGYMKAGGTTIQVLDLPGTLARPEKMNNIELQAELVLKEMAQVVVFVFDLSSTSGYSIEKQAQLLKKIEYKKPLIYVSKTDLPEGKPDKSFPYRYYSFEELKEELEKLSKDAVK